MHEKQSIKSTFNKLLAMEQILPYSESSKFSICHLDYRLKKVTEKHLQNFEEKMMWCKISCSTKLPFQVRAIDIYYQLCQVS